MNFNQQDLEMALSELKKNYPDSNANNQKSIGGSDIQNITEQRYEKLSMKRSRFQNINYIRCVFENIAFSASSFHNVSFEETVLSGSSFACCNFFDSKFSNNSPQNILYKGNNFSQSNFTACKFKEVSFEGSGFLQSLFYNCKFNHVVFQSNTLEGSCFNSCHLKRFYAGHTNVEFVELINTKLKDAIFPFYQFAYIIGASEFLKDGSIEIKLATSEKEVTCAEYIQQIDNLILYYLDKQEYFPACNLSIANGSISAAQSYFLDGINRALETLDFRMIRHFCRLAKRHDLLDEVTIYKARKEIENYLYNDSVPLERINDYIINAGEIRKILLSGKSNSITYNFNIRTNVQKNDKAGIQYIDALSRELNDTLSQNDFGQLGFQVAVSSHSPFEIVIDVICAAGAIATIAQSIWSIVEKKHLHTDQKRTIVPNNYTPVDKTLYTKYIDNRIDLCKEQLFNIKSKYSERKMNRYIEEITQQLKTDITELYDKDIMVFKKSNSNEN